jgi:MoxR-like ATPase
MSTKPRNVKFTELPGLLHFAADNNLNVMLQGEHGVGKTSIITSVLEQKGIKFHYFSSSTLDPWVDFCGVPSPQKNESGESVIRLIRPEHITQDTEAFVFDEFNRSHPKIRNAVMELIQKKSINGRKFDNLRFVWAAINPADHENSYDVEEVDPAQMDRFQIQASLPYEPCVNYFESNYADAGKDAVQWWNNLSIADKKQISPRRLDEAVRVFTLGGPVEFVLSDCVDSIPHSFRDALNANEVWNALRSLRIKKAEEEKRQEVAAEIAKIFSGFTNRKKLKTICYDDDYKNHRWVYAWLPLEICKSVLSELEQEPFVRQRVLDDIKEETGGLHTVLLEEEKKKAMINGDIKTTLLGLTQIQDVTRCIKDLQARNVGFNGTEKQRLVHVAESVLTSAKVAGIISGMMPSCSRGKTPIELSNLWDLEVFTDSVTNEATTMRTALRDILRQMFGLGSDHITRNRVTFARMSPDQKVFGMGVSLFLSAVVNTPFIPKIYSAFHYRMREDTIQAIADEFFTYLMPILQTDVPAFEAKSWTWTPSIIIGGADVLSKLHINAHNITMTPLFSNY